MPLKDSATMNSVRASGSKFRDFAQYLSILLCRQQCGGGGSTRQNSETIILDRGRMSTLLYNCKGSLSERYHGHLPLVLEAILGICMACWCCGFKHTLRVYSRSQIHCISIEFTVHN